MILSQKSQSLQDQSPIEDRKLLAQMFRQPAEARARWMAALPGPDLDRVNDAVVVFNQQVQRRFLILKRGLSAADEPPGGDGELRERARRLMVDRLLAECPEAPPGEPPAPPPQVSPERQTSEPSPAAAMPAEEPVACAPVPKPQQPPAARQKKARKSSVQRRGFAQVPHGLMEAFPDPLAVAVYAWIYRRASGGKGRSRSTRLRQNRLAEESGIPLRTLKRKLSSLVDGDWLERTVRPGRTTEYRLSQQSRSGRFSLVPWPLMDAASPELLCLYAWVHRFAYRSERGCDCLLSTLAGRSGIGLNSTRKLLKQLTASGWLTAQERGLQTTVYRLPRQWPTVTESDLNRSRHAAKNPAAAVDQRENPGQSREEDPAASREEAGRQHPAVTELQPSRSQVAEQNDCSADDLTQNPGHSREEGELQGAAAATCVMESQEVASWVASQNACSTADLTTDSGHQREEDPGHQREEGAEDRMTPSRATKQANPGHQREEDPGHSREGTRATAVRQKEEPSSKGEPSSEVRTLGRKNLPASPGFHDAEPESLVTAELTEQPGGFAPVPPPPASQPADGQPVVQQGSLFAAEPQELNLASGSPCKALEGACATNPLAGPAEAPSRGSQAPLSAKADLDRDHRAQVLAIWNQLAPPAWPRLRALTDKRWAVAAAIARDIGGFQLFLAWLPLVLQEASRDRFWRGDTYRGKPRGWDAFLGTSAKSPKTHFLELYERAADRAEQPAFVTRSDGSLEVNRALFDSEEEWMEAQHKYEVEELARYRKQHFEKLKQQQLKNDSIDVEGTDVPE